nr:hypothetical protein BaRGS_021480 [Batillaria attramentaria]
MADSRALGLAADLSPDALEDETSPSSSSSSSSEEEPKLKIFQESSSCHSQNNNNHHHHHQHHPACSPTSASATASAADPMSLSSQSEGDGLEKCHQELEPRRGHRDTAVERAQRHADLNSQFSVSLGGVVLVASVVADAGAEAGLATASSTMERSIFDEIQEALIKEVSDDVVFDASSTAPDAEPSSQYPFILKHAGYLFDKKRLLIGYATGAPSRSRNC